MKKIDMLKWERVCLGLDPNLDCTPIWNKFDGKVPEEEWKKLEKEDRRALELIKNTKKKKSN